jgi:hypothetical protein
MDLDAANLSSAKGPGGHSFKLKELAGLEIEFLNEADRKVSEHGEYAIYEFDNTRHRLSYSNGDGEEITPDIGRVMVDGGNAVDKMLREFFERYPDCSLVAVPHLFQGPKSRGAYWTLSSRKKYRETQAKTPY